MKHTAGTWRMEEDRFGKSIGISIKSSNTKGVNLIAFLWTEGEGIEDEQWANAQLIISAPDLLETLKDLTSLYAATANPDHNFINKALDVISRAQG